MSRIQTTLAVIVVISAVIISGCSSDRGGDEKQDTGGSAEIAGEHHGAGGEHGEESRGEHARDRSGDGQGEESGTEYALSETYDRVRNGARLVLAYEAESNSFNGMVENTTDSTLKQVRVEVHLSNGRELGPTIPADLGPGEKSSVKLTATSTDFDRWSAHPEVGNEEHSGAEGTREHSGSEEHGERD